MSSLSSSVSSTSGSNTVSSLIEQWGNKPIASCVLGISKIGKKSNWSNKISHSALLLLNKEIDYDQDDEDEILKESGIIIEYGDYSPNMSETEKDYTKRGLVIYHYGDKGGLRYYVKNYREFIEQFADMGYIDLNIDEYNQQTFEHFVNTIAKKEDYKWIQSNYSIGFNNFNCQTFSIEALKELKPYFNSSNIFPCSSDLARKKSKQKLEFIPSNIKTELINYYRK